MEKFGHVFSFEGFVEEINLDASDTGIDLYQKSPGQSAVQVFYVFPETLSYKYKWIADPFHVGST
jgi:hypothetical protein